MRRIETVVLAVSMACLVACGVSVEQAPVLSISTTEDTSDLASRYEALEVAEPHVTSIRLLAADPAQARAMLRSQKLPARHRKLWEDEEIVLDMPSHERIMVIPGSDPAGLGVPVRPPVVSRWSKLRTRVL